MTTAQRGGILVRTSAADAPESLIFIPADVASRVTSLTALTRVEGVRAPALGIALAGGEVVTVLGIGPDPESAADARPPPKPHTAYAYAMGDDWPLPGSDRAVLCDVGGQPVALTGGVVVATGVFDAEDDDVLWRGVRVPILDVRALYAQAESAIWAARVGAES